MGAIGPNGNPCVRYWNRKLWGEVLTTLFEGKQRAVEQEDRITVPDESISKGTEDSVCHTIRARSDCAYAARADRRHPRAGQADHAGAAKTPSRTCGNADPDWTQTTRRS